MTRTMLTALLSLGATLAVAEDAFRAVRVLDAKAGTIVERADGTTEIAVRNLPVLAGDRVLTGDDARAHLQMADGTVLYLGEAAQLEYTALELDEEKTPLLVFYLSSGSSALHASPWTGSRTVLETPHGWVEASSHALCLVQARWDETVLSVRSGAATLGGDSGFVWVHGGRSATVSGWAQPERVASGEKTNGPAARWLSYLRPAAFESPQAHEFLPPLLWPFAAELDRAGHWVWSVGLNQRVWRPYVTASWQPFVDGRWVWTVDDWAWVSDEEWGWIPYHFGRWAHLPGIGWCWVPGDTYRPAWVQWRVEDDYIGWAPWAFDIDIRLSFDPWVTVHHRHFRRHDLPRWRERRVRRQATARVARHLDRDLRPQDQPKRGGSARREDPTRNDARGRGHAIPRSSPQPPQPSPDSDAPSRHPAPRAEGRHPAPRQGPSDAARQARPRAESPQPAERQVRSEMGRAERERREAEERQARQRESDERERQARAEQQRAERERREAEERHTRQRESDERERQARAERERRETAEREAREREAREQRDQQARRAHLRHPSP